MNKRILLASSTRRAGFESQDAAVHGCAVETALAVNGLAVPLFIECPLGAFHGVRACSYMRAPAGLCWVTYFSMSLSR